jgi:hypothetical protein
MNYLVYPTKTVRITQGYDGKYSHEKHYLGKPQSFPIDEAAEDTGRSWFLCPCDEIEIKRIYGVGTGGTNTIWLQSTSKVVTPTFTDYVTIMVIHPNDDDLSKLKVGQKFKRGEQIFREGTDGNVANHFHLSIAQSQFKDLPNNGWVKNDKGAWVMGTNNRRPEECFFIDGNIIKDTKGLVFKEVPKECSNCEELEKEIIVLQDKISLLEKENAALKDFKFSFTATQDGFVRIKMYKDEELRIY